MDSVINGIGKINGGNYKNISINGIGSILNSVNSENITLVGTCKAFGNITCNDISVEGTFSCNSDIEFTNIANIEGLISIDGNFQGKEIILNGKVNVKGLMSADKMNICTCAKSTIKEIGGEDIIVTSTKGGIFNKPYLYVDSIEGDNITLEKTICNIVRGHNITINKGCRIKKLEYTGTIFLNPKSKIDELIKLN